MTGLPASIEKSLIEAGFTQTEILVLKKLLEEDTLTLRELAAKTGKSTGVLDQATKKLLKKRIIVREVVNDTPKYVLKSLETILKWMEEDQEEKLKMMKNRKKDFESFVSSMKKESTRPEMEHFEGREGIEQAYMKLLESVPKGSELLHIRPTPEREEEDPLRVFRVQYFRERRKRGIFSRTITTNTPLGRRFQSRDPFEYRQTQLIPEEDLAISFEKVIAGDTIACFNHSEQKASFLKFPELAAEERRMFEMLWSKSGKVSPTVLPVQQVTIPFGTKTLSAFREFFLSRKSIALFIIFALTAAGITYGLYRQTMYLNGERVKDRIRAIATTGALQIEAKDLDRIRYPKDIYTPEFQKVFTALNEIQTKNENVKWLFVWRPTGLDNPAWEVIADGSTLGPNDNYDLDNDGFLEDEEMLTLPGQRYPYPDANKEKMLSDVFVLPEPYTDEWGTYYEATAPIRNERGESVAVLFVDVMADQATLLSRQSFSTLLFFAGFFCLFVFIRLLAFNKPIFKR